MDKAINVINIRCADLEAKFKRAGRTAEQVERWAARHGITVIVERVTDATRGTLWKATLPCAAGPDGPAGVFTGYFFTLVGLQVGIAHGFELDPSTC